MVRKDDVPDVRLKTVCGFSMYVVFDGCNVVGPTFAMMTATLSPGVLPTIALNDTVQSFNLTDLPCPPASLGWESAFPNRTYTPQLLPPMVVRPPGLRRLCCYVRARNRSSDASGHC